METEMEWDADAEEELKKVPIYLRKQARNMLIEFARQKGVPRITMAVVKEAKAKYFGEDEDD